jgi:hypothetical protein
MNVAISHTADKIVSDSQPTMALMAVDYGRTRDRSATGLSRELDSPAVDGRKNHQKYMKNHQK